MDRITLKNFRCFRDEQTARLAPLTLLVGENSTGKTSFLALIWALWDVACRKRIPDFKEEPYDLGSCDDIAHSRGGRGGRAVTFGSALQDDFENKRLIANPPGAIHSTQKGNNFTPTHKRLLGRVNLCRV